MSSNEIRGICKKMRRDCLIMADSAGSTGFHFGGTFSMIEIVATLYFSVMHIDKDDFNSNNRDRLIISKGHGIPAVYAALKEMGALTEENLRTYKSDDTILYGHPVMNESIGIEFSTGSLGQGLSQGTGCALALKHFNNAARVYVVIGDGECDEGSIWEAAMSASKFGLDNLVVIVDKNKIQYDGDTENVMPLLSLEDKFNSFGWNVCTIDGHDIDACETAFSNQSDKPMVVIANTVKGKGISFMENDPAWHHARMTAAQRLAAVKELE